MRLTQSPRLYRTYQGIKNERWRARILDFFAGNQSLPLTYDPFFKFIFNPDRHADRLENFISSILGIHVKIKRILPVEDSLIDGETYLIMDLLVELKDKINTAIILITHDLGVVAGIADRVAVMYAGKVVETGTTAQIFYEHKHPYTEALLRSLPSAEAGKREPLMSIPGTPPDLLCPPKGCGFAARCRHCMQICREEQPPEFELGDGHKASCWLLHPDCPCAAERGDDQ